MMSASAVFPEPRGPMMATSPDSPDTGMAAQGAFRMCTSSITCDGVAPIGVLANIGASARIDAGLTQGVEGKLALDPAVAILVRRSDDA